jgi:hypothetical protein
MAPEIDYYREAGPDRLVFVLQRQDGEMVFGDGAGGGDGGRRRGPVDVHCDVSRGGPEVHAPEPADGPVARGGVPGRQSQHGDVLQGGPEGQDRGQLRSAGSRRVRPQRETVHARAHHRRHLRAVRRPGGVPDLRPRARGLPLPPAQLWQEGVRGPEQPTIRRVHPYGLRPRQLLIDGKTLRR